MVRSKEAKRQKRKMHIRKNLSGTASRPRLTVFRSNNHIYAQIVDDVAGVTLASADDKTVKSGTNTAKAEAVGADLAAKAKKAKVEAVVFDRNGYRFHGRVKALAEAARAGGLQF